MDAGEVRPVTTGECEDLYLIETGMYDVSGYGCVYVLDTDRPAIVETGIGTGYEHLLEGLATLSIPPRDIETIAVTHIHLDHAGGAGYLAAECEDAEIVVHEIGAPHLVDPERLVAGTKAAVGEQWRYYTEPRAVPEDRIRSITDGDAIDLGRHHLEAVHVPGHAPHQVAFHLPSMDAVFTGDSAGLWIPEQERVHPTSPPPNFVFEQAIADVDTLSALNPETLLFTHFGPADGAIDRLAAYRSTLTEWVEAVEAARAAYEDETAIVEHFIEQTPLAKAWGAEKARAETRINVAGVLTYLDRQNG